MSHFQVVSRPITSWVSAVRGRISKAEPVRVAFMRFAPRISASFRRDRNLTGIPGVTGRGEPRNLSCSLACSCTSLRRRSATDSKDSAGDNAALAFGELVFDLVEPRIISGCVMQRHVWMIGKEAIHKLGSSFDAKAALRSDRSCRLAAYRRREKRWVKPDRKLSI